MQILDTTIRDGSYAVDFKFSCTDVSEIAYRLEKLGVKYIEIGHGKGLNASSYEHGLSLHSDEEYLKAVKKVIKTAKIGFFCIPGIANLDHLHFLKENGGDFVRIGVGADTPEQAADYIKEAKKLGLTVMTNFMKSYTVNPVKLAASAKKVEEYGTDYVYIVDSAGSMLPEDLENYFNAIRQETAVKLGFHGHNNLGMAVANSILCTELGFDLIDCTLQGLGRSIGNTPTEMFVMALEKKGYQTKFDIPCLLEYGYLLLQDIVKKDLQSPLDLVCGYSGFHSGYLKDIYKCCNEKNVDPLRLIIAYSKIDQVNMDINKLYEIADALPLDKDIHPYDFRKFFSAIYNEN